MAVSTATLHSRTLAAVPLLPGQNLTPTTLLLLPPSPPMQISGAAQALQQASLSALDIPSLLEDVRTSLGTAVRDVVQQVRAADIPSSGARAAAGEAATGAAGSGQDEVAVLTEAAVPALVAAVQGVLNRHFSRVMEAPQLQQFVVGGSACCRTACASVSAGHVGTGIMSFLCAHQ